MKATSTFFPIVQIAGFLFLFASFGSCKKNNNNNNSNPGNSVLKDSGMVSMQLGNIPFQSVPATEAGDANGVMDIIAYSYTGGDTLQIELSFPDTLSVNAPYRDTTGQSLAVSYLAFKEGVIYRTLFYGQPTDTLTLTSFDKKAHTIAGVFTGLIFPDGNLQGPPLPLTRGVFNTTYTPVSQ